MLDYEETNCQICNIVQVQVRMYMYIYMSILTLVL